MSTSAYKAGSHYLRQMVVACETIQSYVKNTSEQEFLKQTDPYDAICMQFSQLGEQVAQLEKSPDRIIQHFPDEVPWVALKAIRNRIGHNYASVDAKMIWKFATENTATIESNLKRILKKRFGV